MSRASLWTVLADASDPQEFCQRWLAIQSRLISSVEGGLVSQGAQLKPLGG